MNKLLLMLFFLLSLTVSKGADDDSVSASGSRYSLGININELRTQPGAGLSLTSPYILNDKVALRLSGYVYWLFSIPLSSASEQPLPYINLRFGAVYTAGIIAESIRLNLLGGITYTMPGDKISDDITLGGYAGFGMELFPSGIARSRISFHLESSIIIGPTIAEKLPGQPIYANGIDLSFGIKYYF